MQGSIANQSTQASSGAPASQPAAAAAAPPSSSATQSHSEHHQSLVIPAKNHQPNSKNNNHSSSSSNNHGGPRQLMTVDVPVRILVPSESVGAIIGKGGQTIRQLTQQSRAKVDVYRGELMSPSNAIQEKVITIRGQPDNCINACREILKVMKADSESKGKTNDMPLKVLAHNDYIGRIIGKQGDIINSIKRETDTTVTVSSVNDMSMNVERVITVKGELENTIKALGIIHAKIRSAFENDSKTYGHQAMVMSTIPQIPMLAPSYVPQGPYNGGVSSSTSHHYPKAAQQPHANYPASSAGQLMGASVNNPASQSLNPGGATSSSNYSGYYPPPLIQHLTAITASHHPSPHQGYSPNIPGGPNAAAAVYGPVAGPAASGHALAQGYNPHAHAHHGYLPPQLAHHQPMNEYAAGGAPGQANGYGAVEPEKVFLYIPNTAVGAIIGSKGSYIKNLIKLSGASIKIAPLPAEESKSVSERQVIIVGSADSQCKAQFYIYDKIRQERFTTDDNVKLRAEIQVPASKIGRIIGRAGKNVRELQRTTGATIKLPEDAVQSQQKRLKQRQEKEAAGSTEQETSPPEEAPAAPAEKKEPEEATTASEAVTAASEKPEDAGGEEESAGNSNEFVMVGIIGTFNSSQLAQRRIQSLINPASMSVEVHHMVAPPPPQPVDGKGHISYQYPKSNGFNPRKGGARGGHHAGHGYQGPRSHQPFNGKAHREAPPKETSAQQAPPPPQPQPPSAEAKKEQDQPATA